VIKPRVVDSLGFTPLPVKLVLLLAGLVIVYLLLVELARTRYYRSVHARTAPSPASQAQ
jgi:hypothetical protein